MGVLIKINNLLYDVSDSSYNTESGLYNSIGDENSDIPSLMLRSSLTIELLNTPKTLGGITFKPIDKFDNFSILCGENVELFIHGIKTNNELIVGANDIFIKSDLVNEINYLESLSSTNSVKMIFSTNGGTSWIIYKQGEFISLPINIVLKEYSLLSPTELATWNNNMSYIKENGMTPNELKLTKFNEIDFTKIRLTYVVTSNFFGENSYIGNLQMNFNTLGHLQRMKKSEYDVLLYNRGLYIKPLISVPVIKINSLLKESDNYVNPDKRTELDTPTIILNKADNIVNISWDNVQNVDYYKVYVNGIWLEDVIGLNTNYTIDVEEDFYIFCIRAYSNNTSNYKPSKFSNFESIDYRGYLARVSIGNILEFVGVKLKDKIFKFKVKK